MWRLKLLLQFVLGRLPWGEQINHLLQRIKGSFASPRVKNNVLGIISHLVAVGRLAKIEGSEVVEIGTGWDAIAPLALYLLGAKTTTSYDRFPHLRLRLARGVLDQMEILLDQIALMTAIPKPLLKERLARLKSAVGLEMLLKSARIIYKAPGDAGRTELEDCSIDIIFSNSVLEHVPNSVLHEFTREARRILKPGSTAVHFIGLGDHYAGNGRGISGVNFLKYSPNWWNFFVQNQIGYHNRLREKQFIELFRSHGASVQVISHAIRPDDLKALKTLKIDPSFAGMTHEELAVHTTLLAIFFRDSQSHPCNGRLDF